jgi:tetratricopeptide (TPR) repeat protein
MCSRISLVVSLSLAAACHRVSAPLAAPIDRLAQARQLALAVPGERSPADARIADSQARARRQPLKQDWWIVLGRAWVEKAREANEPGYYLNADACAEVALDLLPESALALDLKGLVLLNDHRFAEARALAERILEKHPDDVMALGSLSDALLELGDDAGAVHAAEQMVALKPNNPSYARVAYLRWLHGDDQGALEVMRLAIDAASGSAREPEPRAWTLTQAALIFWHRGDYDGADAGFDLALKGFPDFAPALVGKGRVALARGEAERAVALLARAYQLSPLVETGWLLGDARALAGDSAGAARAYAQIVRQGRRADPRTLSLYLSTSGRDPALALSLAAAEAERRGDVYTHDAYAWALFRIGQLVQARREIEAALRLGTRDARLLYHAGAIRMAAGDSDGGHRLLADAVRLNPKFDLSGAADAHRLLGPQLAQAR